MKLLATIWLASLLVFLSSCNEDAEAMVTLLAGVEGNGMVISDLNFEAEPIEFLCKHFRSSDTVETPLTMFTELLIQFYLNEPDPHGDCCPDSLPVFEDTTINYDCFGLPYGDKIISLSALEQDVEFITEDGLIKPFSEADVISEEMNWVSDVEFYFIKAFVPSSLNGPWTDQGLKFAAFRVAGERMQYGWLEISEERYTIEISRIGMLEL